jgi:hypothetical protein
MRDTAFAVNRRLEPDTRLVKLLQFLAFSPFTGEQPDDNNSPRPCNDQQHKHGDKFANERVGEHLKSLVELQMSLANSTGLRQYDVA